MGKKLIFSFVLIFVVSVNLFSQQDTICNGETVILRPTVSYETIEWSDADGNVLTTVDGSGVVITDTAPEVMPDVTTTYTAKIVNIGATNKISWGDFENSPTPPEVWEDISDYDFFSGPDPESFVPNYDTGFFTVTNNPVLLHDQTNFAGTPWYVSMGDHTSGTGNMFVANGSTDPNSKVIKVTVAVDSGTTYIVSAWFANIHSSYDNAYKMDIYVDGGFIGHLEGANVGGWYQHFSFWESNKTGDVDIIFKNTRISTGGGNDFAIDDIVFAKVTEETYTVVVKDTPDVVINNAFACQGEGISEITSTSSLPIQSVLWTAPTGFLDDETRIKPSMADSNQAAGTYPVSLKITATNGCSGESPTENIVVFENPEVVVNDTSACQGEGISQITSTSSLPIQSALWTTPTGFLNDETAIIPAMADSNQLPGTYPVSLKVIATNGCSGKSAIQKVIIYKNPTVLLKDQTSELGDGHEFEVTVVGDDANSTYLWRVQDGFMNDSTIKFPVLADIDQEPGEYPIRFKITTENGCVAVSELKIHTITAVDTIVLEMPKAFRPAASSQYNNDIVYVKGLGIAEVVSFQVFNRWGNLIFESSDKNKGWDGHYKGKLLPAGAYGYHVTVRNYANKEYYLKGSILLLH